MPERRLAAAGVPGLRLGRVHVRRVEAGDANSGERCQVQAFAG